MRDRALDPALDVSLSDHVLSFRYGPGVTGPDPEYRTLDAIRGSLLDPHCSGPDPVYGIAMDVARTQDMEDLQQRMLLYGIVVYAAGRLGQEPTRSQGHVHAIAAHSGWSPPEVFEILQGQAIVYAQQSTNDDPGPCVAVTAGPNEKIVVPPGWAHCVINADPNQRMVFAAWCDRQYGFLYDGVRKHGGLAWFPVLDDRNRIDWRANPTYRPSELTCNPARIYPELDLDPNLSLYEQFLQKPDSLMYVSEPSRKADVWKDFLP
jgi:glucose-6-phosphate isomerase, archaeal